MATRTLRILLTGNASQLHGVLGTSTSKLGKLGLAAGAAGGVVAVGLGFAVKSAMGFEKQMSALGAVSDATSKQMEQFRKQALKAGADTAFSAKEAALAQTELAKGGLSVANIMGGGLSAALSLAAAGEIELGEAASVTANAMNLFGLRGNEAGKVADALATAANATTADVADFGMALKQGGAVAKSAGLSFEETVVALEALAASGIKNSDAGTSLKAALIQLIKPTDRQAEMAKKLGLSFVDASGEMKSLGSISAMLRDKLHDQGKAQRTATLATLAGTDGVRTLTSLYDAGPAKLAKWEEGVSKSGTAAEVAKEKQDNLAGAIEQLKGSAETLGIIVGTALIPALTDGTRWVTNFLNQMQSGKGAGGDFVGILEGVKNALVSVWHAAEDVVGWFDKHKTITDLLVVAVGSATAGLITYKATVKAVAIAQGIATFSTTGWVTAFWALNTAISANPFVLAVSALVALGAAMAIAWARSETFRKIVVGALKGVIWVVDKVAGAFSTMLSALGSVPGFGWAKDAANAIDDARKATGKWVNNLNKIPRKKNVDVKIKFTGVTGSIKGQSVRVDTGDILGGQAGAIFGGKGDGTGLMGAKPALAPFAASGKRYGLHVSSGRRPGAITASGNVSNHASGNAIDLSDGVDGPSPAKLRFFNHAKSMWGSRLAELIYTPGGVGVKNGRAHRYTGKVAAGHYDHVHLAYRGGAGDGVGARSETSRGKGGAATHPWPKFMALARRVWRVQAPMMGDTGGFPAVSLGETPGANGFAWPAQRRIRFSPAVPRRIYGSDEAQRNSGLRTVIHEFAHIGQRPGLTDREAEGGAALYAGWAMFRIANALGHPPIRVITRNPYEKEVAWVNRHRPVSWVRKGQFGAGGDDAKRGESGAQVAALARGVGLSGDRLVTSVAISKAESGWNSRASNRNRDGSVDRGLWQVNSVHGQLSTFNPGANARAMAKISSGGSNWRPWVAFTSGAYRKHLSAAKAAVGSKDGGSSRDDLQNRIKVNQDRLDRLRNQLGDVPQDKAHARQRRGLQGQIRSLVASNRNLRGDVRDAPTAVDVRESQERSGSRLVNALAAPFQRGKTGIRTLGKLASSLGIEIEDAGAQYGMAERAFSQSEEDLGTAGGKARRISEISALKMLKREQLARQRKRVGMLKARAGKLAGLIRAINARLTGKNRARGAKAAKIRARRKTYEDDLIEVRAEIKSLGYEIASTQLDIGDLDKEAADVAATPDTAATEAAQAAADAAANAPTTMDKIGSDMSLIELQERAGVYTAEQAKAAKVAQLQAALRGDYGALSDRERLQVMGDLREATNAVAEALADNSSAIRDLKASIDANTAFAQSVVATENYVLTKSLADIVSGQIAGFGIAGRALVPGGGALARY